MKLTPQELIETINAAVEAATKASQPEIIHIPSSTGAGIKVTLGTKFPENVFNIHHSLAAKIMAELAAAGYPTPEETYGFDIEWAVKDALNAVAELKMLRARIQELEAAQKPQQQPVTHAA